MRLARRLCARAESNAWPVPKAVAVGRSEMHAIASRVVHAQQQGEEAGLRTDGRYGVECGVKIPALTRLS